MINNKIGTKEERLKRIGGSEFSTLLEINPYNKRIDLVLEKAGVIASTFKGNAATRRGQLLEDTIIELFEKETGLIVQEKQKEYLLKPEFGLELCCHVDGITDNQTAVFEAKTTDINAKTWSNGIPEYYKAQLEFNCFLAGLKKAYIAVGYCKDNEIIKFEYYEYEPKMSRIDILMTCNSFSSDVEKYKKLGIINSGIVRECEIDISDIDTLIILNEKISSIKNTLAPLEQQKKILENKFKKQIANDMGIENDLYRITLGNRITSPSNEFKISRSNLKIELK